MISDFSGRLMVQEVAPRDGLQIEPSWVATDDKVALIDQLSACGFTRIEAGSFVSPKAIPALRGGAEVFARIRLQPGVVYVALIPNLKGAQRALQAGADELKIADASWLSQAKKDVLSRSILAQSKPNEGHQSSRQVIQTPGVMTLAFIYFLIQIASYGLNFWAPHLIRSAGTSNPTIIGLLTAVPYVRGAISMVIIGRLSDASGIRHKFVIGLMLLTTIGFFGAAVFDKQTTLLIVALGVLGAGVIASIPTFWVLPPKLLTGAAAATGIALISTLGQLSGIVSPVMVGMVKDMTGSTTPALYVIGGITLTCACILAFGLPQHLRQREVRLAN